MLQLFTCEVKKPNLKLYVEIKWTSIEERGKNIASFCKRT